MNSHNYSQEHCPKGTVCEGKGEHSHKTFIDFSEKNELRKTKCWPLFPSDTSSFSQIKLNLWPGSGLEQVPPLTQPDLEKWEKRPRWGGMSGFHAGFSWRGGRLGGTQAFRPLQVSPRKLEIKDMILSLNKSIVASSPKAKGIYLIFLNKLFNSGKTLDLQ